MATHDEDPSEPDGVSAPEVGVALGGDRAASVSDEYWDPATQGGLLARLLARLKGFWFNPAYRFVLLFLPYLAVVSFGYPWVVKEYYGIIQAFIEGTAQIEFWIFDLVSDSIRQTGKMLIFGGFAVKIIDECTGIYEMLIFSAAVLAFPTTWSKKGVGVLLGCPLIYLFNVVRIAVLIAVGRYYPKAFEFMHLYFWQATMIVMITSVWLLWIVKVVRRGEEEEDTPPAPA
jgi:archaeosortase B (VPXXXP-CTERM-specific)